jgi:hypothetical protein
MSIARVAREYKILSWLVQILTPKAIKKGAQTHYNHTYDRVDKRVKRGIDVGKPDVWKLVMEKGDASDISKRIMTADAGGFMVAGTEVSSMYRRRSTYY